MGNHGCNQCGNHWLACDCDRSIHLKHWDTLSQVDKDKWVKLSMATELSAPELAYTNSLANKH